MLVADVVADEVALVLAVLDPVVVARVVTLEVSVVDRDVVAVLVIDVVSEFEMVDVTVLD